jgi:hypothetical protein
VVGTLRLLSPPERVFHQARVSRVRNSKAMPGPTVAIACCRRSGDARPDDLYPDPDAAPLRSALASMGVSSALVAWDDPGADWASFSRVLVSSTWDSVDRPAEYLAWARRVDAATTLVNPAVVIDWGLDKVHQRQLAEARVPVVPTTWVGPGSEWSSPPEGDFVVKPSVSAGGRSTAIYAGADPRAVAHVRALQALGQTVMVPVPPTVDELEGLAGERVERVGHTYTSLLIMRAGCG